MKIFIEDYGHIHMSSRYGNIEECYIIIDKEELEIMDKRIMVSCIIKDYEESRFPISNYIFEDQAFSLNLKIIKNENREIRFVNCTFLTK